MTVERGYSYHTIYGYKKDIQQFLTFIDQNELDLENLTISQLQRFIEYLVNQGFSATSIERKIAAIRTFFKFLYSHYNIRNNIAQLLEIPEKEETIPDVLTVEEVELLLQQPDISTVKGLRDRTMMEFLYATGVRVSEALNIRLYDIDLNEKIVRVSGKGKRERIIPFHDIAREFLERYIKEARPKILKGRQSNYLFLNMRGQRMSRIGFWKILKEYASRVGFASKVHPHVFRHTFATHMLINGCDLRVLQELLGHASISTTQRYTQVNISHLKEIHRKYHPRA